ncbi:hypothetical protein MUK42_20553 [Musa troglodytarum]|uniref:Survival Motor Neuron Gemin2-binding domain-containing protein n=1 Tax=Musa troglodytarum TaxID=320322 RepID=A0A9E7G830_9LILI|nr:hypothetical protein MUK42_20553 [Musa troglodytarum]
MGKGTDLWDDSALIDAFDDAMATYKAVHRESHPAKPLGEGKHIGESTEDEPVHSENLNRQIEHGVGENNVLKDVTETNMPYYKYVSSTEGHQLEEDSLGVNIHATEINSYSSDFHVSTSEIDYHNDEQSIEYNHLLKQYYELEEERQKVLQQLQQANYWNYQTPVQSGEYQAEKFLGNNASESCSQPPYSLCSCHSLSASLIPASACAICGPSFRGYYCCPQNCFTSVLHHFSGCQDHVQSGICSLGGSLTVDPSKQTTHTDDPAVRIGMMAAEKALRSLKKEISVDSNICQEKENMKDKGEISGEHECKASGVISQETDLAVVLSAWYSAGFHTGRQDFYFVHQTLQPCILVLVPLRAIKAKSITIES